MHLCSQRSLWYLGNLVKGIYVNKQKRPNVKKNNNKNVSNKVFLTLQWGLLVVALAVQAGLAH